MARSSNLSRHEAGALINVIKSIATSLWWTILVVVAVSAAAVAIVVNAFGLRVSGGLGLYFIIWWTLLFAVLPFGVRSQAESGEIVKGSEPGAPATPALREKAIWTTLVASMVLVIAAGVLPLSGL
jgi:predicted secreted protein